MRAIEQLSVRRSLGKPSGLIVGLVLSLAISLLITSPALAQSVELAHWLDDDRYLAMLLDMHQDKEARKRPQTRQQLIAIINRAIRTSPSTLEASLLIEAAEQEINSASRARLPQVTVSGQNTYTQTDEGLSSPANGKTGLLIQMQMPLYDSGRIANTVRGREALLASQQAKQNLQHINIAQEVISACANHALQRILLNVNQIYASRMSRLTETIGDIATIDPGRASELTQAKSRQLQAELTLQTLRGKITETTAELERLLKSTSDYDCLEALQYFIADSASATIDTADASMHPQVIATQMEAQSQYAFASQLKATRKPLVQLGVGRSPVNLALSNEYQNSVAVTATLPLYDGNATDRSADAATQRGAATTARAEAQKEKIQSDLKTRSASAFNAAQRLEKYTELLRVSRKVREDYYIQWSTLGRRSLFELLAIESEQLSLQSNYASSLIDLISGVAYQKVQTGLLFKELDLGFGEN